MPRAEPSLTEAHCRSIGDCAYIKKELDMSKPRVAIVRTGDVKGNA